MAFGLWSERPCAVTLVFDVAAGPARRDATRTVLVRGRRQDGGEKILGTLSFSRGARALRAERCSQVALNPGLNEFTFECADAVDGATPPPPGDGRELLVLLHAVRVRAVEGGAGSNPAGPGSSLARPVVHP